MRFLRFRAFSWKTCAGLALAAVAGGALAAWGSHQWVKRVAAGRSHRSIDTVPAVPVALVLGCAPTLANGGPNPFFTTRMAAAASLFKAGKVRALIVSGDNGSHLYDEPTAMKEALIAAGVPDDRIHCDYAGFRTLDSVVRANAIFGQKRFIIVSQHFHNERALFLARQHGLDAIAFDATDISREAAPMTYLREHLARVQAVLDVKLLHTQPKFYGPPVVVNAD